jgi:urease accessory protein UreE
VVWLISRGISLFSAPACALYLFWISYTKRNKQNQLMKVKTQQGNEVEFFFDDNDGDDLFESESTNIKNSNVSSRLQILTAKHSL